MRNATLLIATILCILGAQRLGAQAQPALRPLKVVATVPDLGSLAAEIGGDQVEVTILARGPEDAHFLEARPSFVKAASMADAFIQVGMELEVGWAPAILQNSRNARILRGAPGNIDASEAITPMGVPTGVIDRSMGDVHAAGNPHYLTDPLNGLKVAGLLAQRFSALRPESRDLFESRLAAFRSRVYAAMVGEDLAARYDVEKLAILFENGRLESFLERQGDRGKLGGWFGELSGHDGAAAVADHNLWPYFARRCGVRVEAFLEPKPGVAPTTAHLRDVIGLMRDRNIRLILASPYFDPRHAAFVAGQTGALVVPLAHQCGSRPGTDDYLAMCGYNVRALARALKEAH
jgi:ABC-type Zn uptake system ZnuABC Zn-binding protein ZnuA